MAAYYLDSSALVKRYAQETGSAWVTGITDPPATNEVFISMATGAEVVAALTRKSLMNEMSIHASSAAIAALEFGHFPRRGSVLEPRVAVLGYPGKDGADLRNPDGVVAKPPSVHRPIG
jgi:hypothetical protein